MVFLYNRLGDWMFFSKDGWNEILAIARIYGWPAAGTQPPPPSLDLDSPNQETITWDGNYTRPFGQIVKPEDALALGAAIELSLQSGANWKVNRAAQLRAFPSFCRQRGFIVSSSVFANRPPAQSPRTHVPQKIAS
jgi:hypothetical protein